MAEGGAGTPRSRPGPGHSSYLAFFPGLHPGLCLPTGHSQGAKGNSWAIGKRSPQQTFIPGRRGMWWLTSGPK